MLGANSPVIPDIRRILENVAFPSSHLGTVRDSRSSPIVAAASPRPVPIAAAGMADGVAPTRSGAAPTAAASCAFAGPKVGVARPAWRLPPAARSGLSSPPGQAAPSAKVEPLRRAPGPVRFGVPRCPKQKTVSPARRRGVDPRERRGIRLANVYNEG